MDDRVGRRVAHKSPAGNFDIQGLSVFAIAALVHSVGAVSGNVFAFIAKVHQRRHIVIHNKDNVAAFSAIPAIRAAGRHIFFPMKRNRSIAAFSGVYADARFINKGLCHNLPPHSM